MSFPWHWYKGMNNLDFDAHFTSFLKTSFSARALHVVIYEEIILFLLFLLKLIVSSNVIIL